MLNKSHPPPHPRKSCRLRDSVEKYGTAGRATDDKIISRMHIACWVTKPTDTLRIFNDGPQMTI